MPKVSVVTPTRNRGTEIAALLRSRRAQTALIKVLVMGDMTFGIICVAGQEQMVSSNFGNIDYNRRAYNPWNCGSHTV
jgi:hypothetical protein